LLTRLWGGDLPDIATGDVFATAQPTLWGVHGGSGSAVHIAYASTVTNNTFEWLYHESASFATAPPPIFFCLLSGSSFVDWNLASNNLMKSCLASADYGLAAVWCFNAVAPNGWWRFERLAMGHPLACMLADTFKAYESGVSCRSTYILGDPTLRMQIVAPPANLARCAPSNQVTLTWQASVDPVLGYWMYRSPSPDVPFTNRVSATLIGGTSFTDPSPPSGLHIYYLVRAAKLETSGSGSFTNLSQGAMTYVE
jgi:hypothetical protein